MSDIKKGDRVRVVIEGEVQRTFPGGSLWLTGNYGTTVDGDNVVSVEKIEPPVEVFKPGDRLRRKKVNGWPIAYEVTLGDGGYLHHHTTGPVAWVPSSTRFTSEHYEKVDL